MTKQNQLFQLLGANYDMRNVASDRLTGKTQAQAFMMIAKAMQQPNKKLMIIDHATMEGVGKAPIVNRMLRDRIMQIIAQTEMQFFECGQEAAGNLWLRFNLYTE